MNSQDSHNKQDTWEEERKRLRDKLPSNHKYSVISFYVVATVIVIFILTKIGNNLDKIALTFGAGMRWLRVILIPLALGFALAYLFAPVVHFFQRYISRLPMYRKKGRTGLGTAVALTAIMVAAGLSLGLTFLISAFTHEVTVANFDNITNFVNGISKSLSDVYDQLSSWLDQANISSDALSNVVDSITAWAGGLAAKAGKSVSLAVGNLTGYLTNGLFAIIFAIYFSLDAEGLKHYWKRFFKAVLPDRASHVLSVALHDADRVFSGYIRGQLIDALLMAVMVSIALLLLDVKFAVIIGVLTGFGNLIPYVGPFVAYGGTAVVGILSQDWNKLIVSIIVIFLIQTIDGNVINPRLLSHAVKVHPMLVIIALLVGSKVGGITGMLLAVPVGALLKVWLDRWINILAEKKGKESPL